MDKFISELMDKMTLREKLGQLNLPAGGDLTTGAVQNSNLAEMIRKQELGGFFNVMSVEKIRELQRIAVEETRLGIPLVVGADVIHGYQTIFPIPLALACSWDTLATERMAQISAKEATANGIAWTFSPMVDICRKRRRPLHRGNDGTRIRAWISRQGLAKIGQQHDGLPQAFRPLRSIGIGQRL